MPSVEGRHYYRFKYLQSDHWDDLRLRKLVSEKGRCKRCGAERFNNDVHHLNYRKLFDVELSDLVVLCRPCHEKVHEALDRYADALAQPKGSATWDRAAQGLDWLNLGRAPGEDIAVARERYLAAKGKGKAARIEKRKAEQRARQAITPKPERTPPVVRMMLFRVLRQSGILPSMSADEKTALAKESARLMAMGVSDGCVFS